MVRSAMVRALTVLEPPMHSGPAQHWRPAQRWVEQGARFSDLSPAWSGRAPNGWARGVGAWPAPPVSWRACQRRVGRLHARLPGRERLEAGPWRRAASVPALCRVAVALPAYYSACAPYEMPSLLVGIDAIGSVAHYVRWHRHGFNRRSWRPIRHRPWPRNTARSTPPPQCPQSAPTGSRQRL